MSKVKIRRQCNDWGIAEVDLEDLHSLRWSSMSGGVYARAPQFFVHGYTSCDCISGDIAHSCAHGEGPHRIKVCLVKKDQSNEVWRKILAIAGPKPASCCA